MYIKLDMHKTIALILVGLLLCNPIVAELSLNIQLDDNTIAHRHADYAVTGSGEVDNTLTSGQLTWRTYGYYGIYKLLCVSLGLFAVGYATGFAISSMFVGVLGADAEADRLSTQGKWILWTGIAAAYGLALFGPMIVDHNTGHRSHMETIYPVELACNAGGILCIALSDKTDSGLLTGLLYTSALILFFIPVPATMSHFYETYESPPLPSPGESARMNFRAATFSITDRPDGSRDWTLSFDFARTSILGNIK